jgi:twitching motility protein PilT
MNFTSRDDLDVLLNVCKENDAADLHLGPGRPPMMRVHGNLVIAPNYPNDLTTADMDVILEHAYRTATGPAAVQGLTDLDFSYMPGRAIKKGHVVNDSIYRVNAGMSIEGIRMVFRQLPASPPTMSAIEAPPAFQNILDTQRQGLVLVTGPTGSGKSTTLAAGIRYLLEGNNSLHVITLENPVEFRYTQIETDAAYVTQREVGRSLKSFASGMRSALRQDPDVILVGELRDLETMRLAMEAAETGHLVFGTVHTTNVSSTISRIVQMFPSSEQAAARVQLLSSLRFIICQQLLQRSPKGRVACREFLEFTPSMRSDLMEMNPAQVVNTLTKLVDAKGVSMLSAISDLGERGLISQDEYNRMRLVLQAEESTASTHTEAD